MSADALVYFGDLTGVTTAFAGALRPNGIVVFTLEQAVRERAGAAAGARHRRRGDRIGVLFAAVHMSLLGTTRTSEDVRVESAKRSKSDIDHAALTYRDVRARR